MVDLMMWLVIAALLLAAAIQSIGYYQKAALLNQMETDLSGVASRVMAQSSMNSGVLDAATVQAAADSANWSNGIIHTVESTSTGKTILRATNPGVPDSDTIYLFDPCGGLSIGVNVVPKTGNAATAACGIAASDTGTGGGTGGGGSSALSFNTLTWQTPTNLTSGNYNGLAASADGKKMYAASYYNDMYSSTDGGTTWNVTSAGSKAWIALSTSADGKVVLAAANSDTLYLSTDSGTTWTAQTAVPQSSWNEVKVSGDGKTLIAGSSTTVYTSTNGGAWTAQTTLPSAYWTVALSDDGKVMIANDIASAGYVYVSTDSGTTWSAKTSMGMAVRQRVAVSGDGTKMYVAQTSGIYYVSTDNGNNWSGSAALGFSTDSWKGFAVSTDGSKMFASTFVSGHGYRLFTSLDSGTTWTEKVVGAGGQNWVFATASEDGTHLMAGSYTGISIGTYGP